MTLQSNKNKWYFAIWMMLGLAINSFALAGGLSDEMKNSTNQHSMSDHRDSPISPPDVAKYPTLYQVHGELVVDDYAWLYADSDERNRLIEQENAHTAHHLDRSLINTLSQEIKKRSKVGVSDEIWLDGGIFFKKDNTSFPKVFIKSQNKNNQNVWTLLLDTNAEKQMLGVDTYQLGTIKPAPNAAHIAISYDTIGNEVYAIDIADKTGRVIDRLTKTAGQVVWLNHEYLVYVNDYHNQVLRHKLGTSQSQDVPIYHKQNQRLGLSLDSASSDEFVLLTLGNMTTAQTLFAKPEDLIQQGEFTPFGVIEQDREYYLEHYQGRFYLKLSDQNGAALYVLTQDDMTKWRQNQHLPNPIFMPNKRATLESFAFVGDYLIVKVRQGGVHQIFYANVNDLRFDKLYHVIDKKDKNEQQFDRSIYAGDQVWRSVKFDDEAYMVWIKSSGFDIQANTNPHLLRLGYTSPSTPKTVRYYDLLHHQFVNVAQTQKDYQTKRLWIASKDGTKLPITLVYKTGLTPTKDTPLLIYGYGAYGFSLDPVYGSSYISLLDRGFVYVFAHIRGGGELGQAWHNDGKLTKKQNSFDDFVAATKSLHQQGYGSPANTFAMGESAGGLVVANVCTTHPELYKACVMQVPFLDVLSNYHQGKTDDEDQYSEWGDPSMVSDYRTIAHYNPYTNLTVKHYPNMLIIAHRQDARVNFVDSLKFIAKLRAYQIDNNHSLHLIAIKDGGHSGTGQNSRVANNAMAYAFILQQCSSCQTLE
ncbi:prolyl oligopeptidase family serine peptidase [Moraxella equi]|uniref:Protease 2 n=1 Tax=Moraxella equi TaxID=60442 RepID=A0A378QLX4_9GAMM|nr:prolyl oligopeptidase family serine peptidase [Moraxella equi]OPH38641.1 hypothetical protein B5J93_05660 [Moraxella equi]STZ01835.1 Protease 2 [Moraxella equi]